MSCSALVVVNKTLYRKYGVLLLKTNKRYGEEVPSNISQSKDQKEQRKRKKKKEKEKTHIFVGLLPGEYVWKSLDVTNGLCEIPSDTAHYCR